MSGTLQLAAYRPDAVHGELEPARQLDAVAGLAGPHVHRERTRRQAEPGDQVKQQAGAPWARLWSNAAVKASHSAKADP